MKEELTIRMKSRVYYCVKYTMDNLNARAVGLREEAGIPSGTSTVSQAFYKAKDLGLVTSKETTPRLVEYAPTKKGIKFVESIDPVTLLGKHEAFAPTDNLAGTAASKVPDLPTTETENAAIDGIARLIDENKRLRALLKRFALEVNNELG